MNEKHLNFRIKQCIELASLSNCPRRKFGALLLDPIRNVVLIDAYNGGPRGGSRLCAGETCGRIDNKIPSGTRVEVGCHHAEMNIICNAAAGGVCTSGAWLIVNGEPCVMCAKLIHHAGIAKVVVVGGVYNEVNGIDYLRHHGVEVEFAQSLLNPCVDSMPIEPSVFPNARKALKFLFEDPEENVYETAYRAAATPEKKKEFTSFLDGLVERTLAGITGALDEYKLLRWDNMDDYSKVLIGLNKETGTDKPYPITLRQIREKFVLRGPFGSKIVSSEKDGLFQAFLYLKQNPK